MSQFIAWLGSVPNNQKPLLCFQTHPNLLSRHSTSECLHTLHSPIFIVIFSLYLQLILFLSSSSPSLILISFPLSSFHLPHFHLILSPLFASSHPQVKLVLAAAMWNRPHIIVLDEPTNYLDREALGALTQAIKGFHGGVVIISHNSGTPCLAVCTAVLRFTHLHLWRERIQPRDPAFLRHFSLKTTPYAYHNPSVAVEYKRLCKRAG